MVRRTKISPYLKSGLLFPHNSGRPIVEEKQEQPECSVWGALALTLYVSRIFGIAPLSFTRQDNECRIRYSTAMSVYSYLLFSVLNAACFADIVIELTGDYNPLIKQSPTSNVLLVAKRGFLLFIVNYGMISAKKRMNCIISCLCEIDKIRPKPNKDPAQISTERKRFIATAVYIVALFLISIIDTLYNILSGVPKNLESNKTLDLIYYCFIKLISYLLETQFMCTALLVKSAVISVNDNLANIMPNIDLKGTGQVPLSTKALQRTVRHLFLSNGTICDVIGRLDKSFGFIILMLLSYFVIRLVMALYIITVDMISKISSGNDVFTKCFFFLLQTTILVLIIEPGHMTLKEMKQTQKLVRKLSQIFSSPNDPLSLELNQFIMHIEQNQVVYSPMGLCTLTRPLIATVFGAVTTCFVLILQFISMDIEFRPKQ